MCTHEDSSKVVTEKRRSTLSVGDIIPWPGSPRLNEKWKGDKPTECQHVFFYAPYALEIWDDEES